MESGNPNRSKPGGRGRLAVVSGYAHNTLTPRGQRTQWAIRGLEPNWDVELIGLPAETFNSSGAPKQSRSRWRRMASDVVRSTMLDRWEPWSARRLAGWRPDVDAALLIAYPWSPVAYAARRLRAAGIPYVVDTGDPWTLTSAVIDTKLLARSRTRRAERAIWSDASGAVVTTEQQRDVLEQMFPGLPVLVRPNGYDPVAAEAPPPVRPPAAPGRLRLAHYGMLSALRLDVSALLEALLRSGYWDSISFTQYGDDYAGMLSRVPAGVEVDRRSAQPWSEVLSAAGEFDLAVVVGNWLTGQLPSKAIQYMTLPVPRLALTQREHDDALADYVRGRPGWLALAIDDPEAGRRVRDHLERRWSAADLAPPAEEAWPAVAERIAGFVTERAGSPPEWGAREGAEPARSGL